MNSDRLTQLLQTGFHLSVGATASLIESLQDSQTREEIFSKLMTSQFDRLAEEWAKKGELTEQEAREFVNSLLQQQSDRTSRDATEADNTAAPDNTAVSAKVQQEVRELTAQIAAMRAELEKLRTQDSQS